MSPSAFLSPSGRRYKIAALGLAVLSVPLVPVLASPAPAMAQAPGTGAYEVYLVLPSTVAGESKAAGTKGELLSAFSLSVAAQPAPGPATSGLGAGKVTQSAEVTATMPIDATSVGLLQDVSVSQPLNLEVDFWRSVKGSATKFLAYKFSNATFTSYALADGPTGESVQVVFVFAKIQATVMGSGGTTSVDTWSQVSNKSV